MTRPIARRAEAADVAVLVDLMEEFYAEASYPPDRVWAASAFAELVAEPRDCGLPPTIARRSGCR